MVRFEKNSNSVVITTDDTKSVYPLGTLITHTNAFSESIDLKLRASRKTILSFNYDEVDGIEGENAKEVQQQLALYL